ncbi:hypothetical protein M8J77_004386 [Diaphorina citri]|nr:hypothetical protein M8J77_004386 [Diaphorina citri]
MFGKKRENMCRKIQRNADITHWNHVMNRGASNFSSLNSALLTNTVIMDTSQYKLTASVIFTYLETNVPSVILILLIGQIQSNKLSKFIQEATDSL